MYVLMLFVCCSVFQQHADARKHVKQCSVRPRLRSHTGTEYNSADHSHVGFAAAGV